MFRKIIVLSQRLGYIIISTANIQCSSYCVFVELKYQSMLNSGFQSKALEKKIHPVLHLYLRIAHGTSQIWQCLTNPCVSFPCYQLGAFPWESHARETARARIVGTQGKGCKEQPLGKPANLNNQTNSAIMPLGL